MGCAWCNTIRPTTLRISGAWPQIADRGGWIRVLVAQPFGHSPRICKALHGQAFAATVLISGCIYSHHPCQACCSTHIIWAFQIRGLCPKRDMYNYICDTCLLMGEVFCEKHMKTTFEKFGCLLTNCAPKLTCLLVIHDLQNKP